MSERDFLFKFKVDDHVITPTGTTGFVMARTLHESAGTVRNTYKISGLGFPNLEFEEKQLKLYTAPIKVMLTPRFQLGETVKVASNCLFRPNYVGEIVGIVTNDNTDGVSGADEAKLLYEVYFNDDKPAEPFHFRSLILLGK